MMGIGTLIKLRVKGLSITPIKMFMRGSGCTIKCMVKALTATMITLRSIKVNGSTMFNMVKEQ
jgi:hypothetical protein